MKRLAGMLFFASLAVLLSTSTRATDIPASFSLFETDPSETSQDLFLPANFFGPDCPNPFSDEVFFEGVPLKCFDPDGPGSQPEICGLKTADTVVERLADAAESPTGDTIPIQIVALHLRSVDPITVSCTGGPQLWDVEAIVEPGIDQDVGCMTIRHDVPTDGGTADSVLPVRPLLKFARVGTNQHIDFIPPPEPPPVPCPPSTPPNPNRFFDFRAQNVPWDHVANPLDEPPGDVVVEVPGLTGNFFLGIDGLNGPLVPGRRVKILVGELAQLARHGVRIAEQKPHFTCHKINGDPLNVVVEVQTQFGTDLGVQVLSPEYICPPTLKNGEGDRVDTHLKCYNIMSAMDPDVEVTLEDQFGLQFDIEVGPAKLLCAPALKTVVDPPGQAPPDGPLPESPHYQCFEIVAPGPDVTVELDNQFGVFDVALGDAKYLCPPALKTLDKNSPAEGDLSAPHLKCYEILLGPNPPHVVDIETQFGLEETVPVQKADLMCGPVRKFVSAGSTPPDEPVTITKFADLSLELNWGASCQPHDDDYEVYEGTIGDFTSHVPTLCSTGGETSATIDPSEGNKYFLIVPRNESVEGSYGTSSVIDGETERPPSTTPCLPQQTADCPS